MGFARAWKLLPAAICILMISSSAVAQCLERDNFTYCPDTDTMYILTEKSLEAFQVSAQKINWRIEFPKGTIVNSEVAATADVVAFVEQSTSFHNKRLSGGQWFTRMGD